MIVSNSLHRTAKFPLQKTYFGKNKNRKLESPTEYKTRIEKAVDIICNQAKNAKKANRKTLTSFEKTLRSEKLFSRITTLAALTFLTGFGGCAGFAGYTVYLVKKNIKKENLYMTQIKSAFSPEKAKEFEQKAELVKEYGCLPLNPKNSSGNYLEAVIDSIKYGLGTPDKTFKIDSLISEETKKQLSTIKTLDSSKTAAENTVKFLKSLRK